MEKKHIKALHYNTWCHFPKKNVYFLHFHSYFQIDVYAPHNLCVISFHDCSLQVAYKFICCYFFYTFVVIYFSFCFSFFFIFFMLDRMNKIVLIVSTIKKNCRINFHDFSWISKLNWGNNFCFLRFFWSTEDLLEVNWCFFKGAFWLSF